MENVVEPIGLVRVPACENRAGLFDGEVSPGGREIAGNGEVNAVVVGRDR
jgi:hypothetical protein